MSPPWQTSIALGHFDDVRDLRTRLLDRAAQARARGDLEDAPAILGELIAVPDDFEARVQAAWTLAHLGRDGEAAAAFDLVADRAEREILPAAHERWTGNRLRCNVLQWRYHAARLRGESTTLPVIPGCGC